MPFLRTSIIIKENTMAMAHSLTSTLFVRLGMVSMPLAFMLGCAMKPETPSVIAPSEGTQEIEVGHDPEVPGATSGAPQDCVENDERPVCQIRPRGMEFFAVKIKNEAKKLCLRPEGGSTKENVLIVLSECKRTKSRLWKKEFNNRDRGPNKTYRFVNVLSGKCIKKDGRVLRQVTCASSGLAPNGPEAFQFHKTPPFGSGDFIQSTNLTGGAGCVRAGRGRRVNLSGDTCPNDAKQRWYQSIF
jgi:hypothetical protein